MDSKFSVGQSVEHTPVGTVPGRYVIVRQMPSEHNQSETRYRIRGELAGEERVVSESALSDNVGTELEYAMEARARAERVRKK